jgi:hypothetical protein
MISTWRTTRVKPFTSPPLAADSLSIEALYAPIVYIRLHGMPGQPYLYGDPGLITALSAKQVIKANFNESDVFLEGCYGDMMADAFLCAGARSVSGSRAPTWGRRWRLGPSSIVGREWLHQILSGKSPETAMQIASETVSEPFNFGWFTKKGVYI